MLTTQQIATLHTELTTDPEGLGYAPYVASGDLDNIITILTWIRDGVTPSPNNGVIGPSGAITGASNATPIVITSAAHGRAVGDSVVISGVLGNTGANGTFVISAVTANTFTLTGSVGNGAYTSGGTWSWCITTQANGTALLSPGASALEMLEAFAPADMIAATPNAAVCAWNNMLASYFATNPNIPLTNAAGVENNIIGMLKKLVSGAATSVANLEALKFRNGDRIEEILNAPFIVPDLSDVSQAL